MKIAPALHYAPCPCGSGKKFKFRHLNAVRGALPDDPSSLDVTAAVRHATPAGTLMLGAAGGTVERCDWAEGRRFFS